MDKEEKSITVGDTFFLLLLLPVLVVYWLAAGVAIFHARVNNALKDIYREVPKSTETPPKGQKRN